MPKTELDHAKMDQELTPSVMAATGMMPTHPAAEDTTPLTSSQLMSAALAVVVMTNARKALVSTLSEMAATGMMPTHQAAEDTTPPTSPHGMSALLAEPVMLVAARTDQESTPSEMAATGMMPTHPAAEDTTPPTSPLLKSAVSASEDPIIDLDRSLWNLCELVYIDRF